MTDNLDQASSPSLQVLSSTIPKAKAIDEYFKRKRKAEEISQLSEQEMNIILPNSNLNPLKKGKDSTTNFVSSSSSSKVKINLTNSSILIENQNPAEMSDQKIIIIAASQKEEQCQSSKKEKVLNDHLREKYLKNYLFLRFEEGLIYCHLCRKYGFINVLSKGKAFLRDTHIIQHLEIQEHIEASKKDKALTQNNSNQIEKFFDNRQSVQDEELLPLFRSIFWLSSNNISLYKCQSLHSLLDYQKVKQNTNYRNPVSGKEILVCVAETIRDNVLTKIKKSPFIGISVDESTDVTNDAQLSLCIQYTVYDEVKNEFIKLFNIKKRDAETIFQVLLKFLKENNLLAKLNSISTDGAAVMKSLINGVCGRFKRIIPNVITVHCVAHRLALGVKCLKQDEDFVGVNTVVHRIISFLTGSGNRLNILEKNEIEMLELDLRLIKPHDIRWLSHFSVLRRLLELYPAIIQTLIDIGNEQKDELAKHLASIMSNFNFLAKIHILCDILSIIQKPMKIFQSQTLSINDFLSCIQTCISSLESLYAGNDMGVYLADLYATFNVLEKSWKNYSFDFNENDKTTMHDLALKTAKKVAEDVKEHFPDNQILNNMKVLEIPYLKSILKPLPKDQISAVGNQELETLIKYYNTFLTNRNNGLSVNVAELKLDKTECLGEWRELKINIKDHLLIEEPEIRQKIMSRLHYPNLHLLYHFMSVIPLSTTECERTFSSMNLIKTEQRNQMNHDTLDYHMLISLLGPSENEYIESICKNALELWKNSRKRYNL